MCFFGPCAVKGWGSLGNSNALSERSTQGEGEAEARKVMRAKPKVVEGIRGRLYTNLRPFGRAGPVSYRWAVFLLRKGGSGIE